jgi:hypothetical protein
MRRITLQGRTESGPIDVEICFVSHLDPDLLHSDLLDLPPDVDFAITDQTIEQTEDRLIVTLFISQMDIEEQ